MLVNGYYHHLQNGRIVYLKKESFQTFRLLFIVLKYFVRRVGTVKLGFYFYVYIYEVEMNRVYSVEN